MILALVLALVSVPACASTSVVLTGTAPSFNSAPGCAASADTLRDLKEILLEGRRTGTTVWAPLKRQPATPGQNFSLFVSGLIEALWDFRVFAVDSTGNQSCADSTLGMNLVRTPAKPTITNVAAP